jgi:hypothetical protein
VSADIRDASDVTPIFCSHLELEQGASGVLAWQGEEAMTRSRFSEEKIIDRPQRELPRAIFSQQNRGVMHEASFVRAA